MKTIFHKLNEAKIPYAVVTAYIKCKGITTHHGKDIFIIGSVRDSGYLRSCGFSQTSKGHDSVPEYTLSNVETEDFKQRITNKEFRVVQDDEDGMIYEPVTVNSFVAYCGGKRKSQPRIEPKVSERDTGEKPGRKPKPLPQELMDKRKTINLSYERR